MSRHPHPGAPDLDDLLDGALVDDSAVSRVLCAARAPGSLDEVAGLGAAMSAFYRTGPAAPRPPARAGRAARHAGARRWLALKAAAVVSGVSLLGGVAWAATTTGFLGGSHPAPHHKPASHSSTSAGSPGSVRQQGGTIGTASEIASGVHAHPTPTTPKDVGPAPGQTNHGVGVPNHGSSGATHGLGPSSHPHPGSSSAHPSTSHSEPGQSQKASRTPNPNESRHGPKSTPTP